MAQNPPLVPMRAGRITNTRRSGVAKAVGIALALSAMALQLLESSDRDGDGLPRWQERRIGTDPSNNDTDGDALQDGWEVMGMVPSLVRSAHAQGVPLPGADPLRKDLFVEVDWMRGA